MRRSCNLLIYLETGPSRRNKKIGILLAHIIAYPVILWDDKSTGEKQMLTLYYMIKNRLTEEEGQDLVEYALIIALIALACTAGLNGLATAIKAGFTSIGADV